MDWIKVENKLPEHNQWVLTWWNGCRLPLTAIFKKGKKKDSFIGIDGESWMISKDEITHWVPLPEEPREGKNVADAESKLNLADVNISLPGKKPLFIDWIDKYFTHAGNDDLYKSKSDGKVYPQRELYKRFKKAYKIRQ